MIYDREIMTSANRDTNLISIVKTLATMLQDFYAERLGAMYVLHVNWFYRMMYQAVKYLLHQKTRDKFHVLGANSDLLAYFDEDQLMRNYGGFNEYVHPYPE